MLGIRFTDRMTAATQSTRTHASRGPCSRCVRLGPPTHHDERAPPLQVTKVLNIKTHLVTDRSGRVTELCGPFDMEGHRGDDTRHYMLDFHRLFPPEPPDDAARGNPCLYRFLRPELVRQSPVPLSSDAFSAVGAKSDEKAVRSAAPSRAANG